MLCPFMYPSALPEQKGYIMKKVIYTFANGEKAEIEVNDELAAVIAECERAEHANDEKQRYHCYSLDECDYEGADFACDDKGFSQLFEENKESERLSVALSHLTKCQFAAVQAVFFEGLTQEEYAAKRGIKQSTVSIMIKRALIRIKKFL